jgi:ATP-dependent Clp protease ATP-binding subunit ClpB
LLFDEIEKASDSLWGLLLGILDKAVLTLGDNRQLDFSQRIIIVTSNLGACELSSLVEGGIGFNVTLNALDGGLDDKINRTAVAAARRKFTPEFHEPHRYSGCFQNAAARPPAADSGN